MKLDTSDLNAPDVRYAASDFIPEAKLLIQTPMSFDFITSATACVNAALSCVSGPVSGNSPLMNVLPI